MDDVLIRSVIVRSNSENKLSIPLHSCQNVESAEIEVLIDSGAEGKFVDEIIVPEYSCQNLLKPIKVRNIDGSLNVDGNIKQEVRIRFKINDIKFDEWFYITNLGDQQMILGMPWLEAHNPLINWKKKTIEAFDWKSGRSDQMESIIRYITSKGEISLEERSDGDSGVRERLNGDFKVLEDVALARQWFEDSEYVEREEVWIRVKLSASQQFAQAAGESKEKTELPERFQEFAAVFKERESGKMPEW